MSQNCGTGDKEGGTDAIISGNKNRVSPMKMDLTITKSCLKGKTSVYPTK